MSRLSWLGPLSVLLMFVGCLATPGTGTGSAVEMSGVLFVDMHVDSPCNALEAPPELAGVTLTFRGPDGERVGEAVSGPIGHRLLEFGEGKDGWQHPGCRYITPYSVNLPKLDSYSVTFDEAAGLGPDEMGAGFTGISDLGEQVISYAELEANGFAWDFEVQPSYVVGH